MKNLSLIVVLFLVIGSSSLMAQINVNSSGYIGINNTSPAYRLDVAGTLRFNNGSKIISFEGFSFAPLSSTGVGLGNSSNYWGSIWATSAFFTNQPTITSDINYKENITDLSSMSTKLKQLRPVTYKLKTDVPNLYVNKDENKTQFGFLAQELQKVFPEMVTSQDNGILGIQYAQLIPVLVQALKEQQDQIDLLNERIKVLENTLK